MARPKKLDGPIVNLGFTVPASLVARVDRYCVGVMQERGHHVSRSDAIRVLLDRALTAEGIATAEAPKGKRK